MSLSISISAHTGRDAAAYDEVIEAAKQVVSKLQEGSFTISTAYVSGSDTDGRNVSQNLVEGSAPPTTDSDQPTGSDQPGEGSEPQSEAGGTQH